MTSREYHSDELVVRWNAERCIHAADCIASAPAVFDTSQRPWVRLDKGSTDEIVAAIERCPTGALSYERVGAPEAPPPQTTASAVPGGPLLIRGPITIYDEDGSVLAEGSRFAICRCGRSKRQPFCDNSHRLPGERRPAEPVSPLQICPRQPDEFVKRSANVYDASSDASS
ncbi:MAG TPA: (4Fe-4S)-binding protein [Actinomycetota bacterium]|nr:(4Fe-4S)-binding protein [Actinomycetota bacterium]